MPNGLFQVNSSNWSISNRKCACFFFFFFHYYYYYYYYYYYHGLEKYLYLNANSIDPDQTPRSAASDLGLHCLHMSHLWDARLK